MSDTADRVKKIVVEHLGVEADKVTEDASFIDDLGADSLDIVELVMAFEERRCREDQHRLGRDQVHRRKQGLIGRPAPILSVPGPGRVAGLQTAPC
jgi:hypothetical protein